MCNCNDNINSVTVYTGPAGPTGPQGPAGNDSILTGTSTSNLAATTGTKTIVTQANISWVPGMRLRVSDGAPATPRIMEGEVSTYTGTTLVLNVDYTEGPASLWNNWVIGVSGAVGPTGPTGATGATGAAGADSFDLLQNAIFFSGSTYTLTVQNSTTWMSYGMILYIANPATAVVAGYYQVTNILSINQVIVSDLGYPGNSTANLTGALPLAMTISAAGIRGAAGTTGAAGPANSLSIGSVGTGTAAASITGTAPSQILNLTLPYGPAGPASYTTFTATTYPAGSTYHPAIIGAYDVDIMNTAWIAQSNPPYVAPPFDGQIIFIQGAGYFQVITVNTSTSITVYDVGYPGNNLGLATPAGIVTSGGLQGPAGSSTTGSVATTIDDGVATTYNGTSYYTVIGDLVHVEIDITMTTVPGTGSSQFYVTLPYQPLRANVLYGGYLYLGGTTNQWPLHVKTNAANTQALIYFSQVTGSNIRSRSFTDTQPETWTTDAANVLKFSFTYEKA
jgi:hypothetical protein